MEKIRVWCYIPLQGKQMYQVTKVAQRAKLLCLFNGVYFRGASQLRVMSQLRVTIQIRVRFQIFFLFFIFSFFFSSYTNDVRAITRNINFPVGDIFDRKSHYRCVSPLPHQDTWQLSILIHFLRILRPQMCTYLKNMSHFNTRYTGKTDGEGSQSQEYLTFALEPSCCVHKHNRFYSSPVSIKHRLRTVDYGLRTVEYGLRTAYYRLRTGYKTQTSCMHFRMIQIWPWWNEEQKVDK